MGKLLNAVALCAIVTGCAALRSLNDVRKDLCDLTGEANKDAIAVDAEKAGISFEAAYAIWRATCLIRVQQAEQEAVEAGSEAIGAQGGK
jgi:hypothetical protein